MFNQIDHSPVIRRIAIVGSGLAGLTAALLLREHDHSVTVFEKSRGPGGRMAAKRVPGGSADIGAQYFTVRNPAFSEFLRRHAGEGSFGSWSGRFGYQNTEGQWKPFPREERYVGIPRMTAITRGLSGALDIQAQTRIERLVRQDPEWTLLDTDGKSYGPFDAVIVTAPPAQARDLFSNSGLQSLADELEGPVGHVQPCWAVAAHFSQPLGQPYEAMRCQDPVLNWIANNSSKPGREGASGEWWVLHADSEWSRENENTPAKQVEERMIEAFQRVTGISVEPDERVSHRWLYAKSSATDQPGFRWFNDLRVGLAGDWLSGGRVEGAFNSASSLVEHMLAG
ncbi:FAD-dependent oxidoreductase [Marinobacter sp. 71-i]|uniref:FAD-dependent oxidoreductase n=1 Tax=Marinobacter iranensis TaxID=2962607 RepID=A0ABT5Y9A8_9GAMM|nr:FAD-dependent oxidoreductase [Marinobacter iranensis]MDF0750248.1 FAD-dependent oxidoreductase [Marinobacter iranensis]